MGALSDKAKQRSTQSRATKPEPSPVRQIQINENKDFAKECQDHGADGKGIAAASKRVNDRTYTTTPNGKPETWPKEDQQKQAAAKRRASDDIRAIGPFGNEEIIKVAGDSAAETRGLVNRVGIDAVWDVLFGKPSQQAEEAIEEAIEDGQSDDEPEFLTRAEQIRRDEAARRSSDSVQEDSNVEPFKFFPWL